MSLIHFSMRQHHDDADDDIIHHHTIRDNVLQQIEAMILKESTGVYRVNNYILSHRKDREVISSWRCKEDVNPAAAQQDFLVDDLCRQKMCEWSYRIIDTFNGRRELVAMAQNYIDRFLDRYRW